MKLDWNDFNTYIQVITPNGKGTIIALDESKNQVSVSFGIKGSSTYNIEEIELPLGTIKPSISFGIGQFVLLFQRIENRLKDMLIYVENGKHEKNTTGVLINRLNQIINDSDSPEILNDWSLLNNKLIEFNKTRTTLIHGYYFHYKNDILDYNIAQFINPKGQKIELSYEALDLLCQQTQDLYFKFSKFMLTYIEQLKISR